MREIKFRGKGLEGGEWIHGYYYNQDAAQKVGVRRHIIVYEPGGPGVTTIHDPIDIDTLGQYTGIKDINGVKIYENDIVKYQIGVGRVYYDEAETSYVLEPTNRLFDYEILGLTHEPEVIGNVHDNPELIKENDINE